jgi:hypothetical protein
MAFNWDAFASEVSGGVKRGASTYANQLNADIYRRREQEDRVALVQQQHDWQDKRDRDEREWNVRLDLMRRGLDRREEEWKGNFQLEQQKRLQKINEDFDTFLGDPTLQGSLAAMKIGGLGPVADNIMGTINGLHRGLTPDKLTPGQRDSIRFMAPGPRKRMEEMIKVNISEAKRLAYMESLMASSDWQLDKLKKGGKLGLDEVSKLEQDATVAMQGAITKKAELEKEMWYMDAMKNAADLGIDVNVPLSAQRPLVEAYKKKDIGKYNQFMSAMSQMSFLDEALSRFKPLADMWKQQREGMLELGTEPAVNEEDKKTYADFMTPTPGTEPLKNPQYRKPQEPQQKGINVRNKHVHKIANIINNLGAPYVSAKEVKSQYGLPPEADVQVINLPEHYSDMIQNGQNMPAGVYFYDAHNHDLVVSLGGGYFIKVDKSSAPAKK